jgi:outer membrane protein insertion porin family
MKKGVQLAALLVLLATSGASQIAAGIHVVDVRFSGDTRLESVKLKECAAGLKSRIYGGSEWLANITERVRLRCLQDEGYFRASVEPSAEQLPDKHDAHQFVVTFNIEAGPRYRLGEITFKNNHAISNPNALRNLFPIKDGDIFDRNAIAKGLENLRYAYGELGYINFTAIPDATFNDTKKLAVLEIELDQGKQFYVSSIDIVGTDPGLLNDLPLKPGQVYNVRLVDVFLQRHLHGAAVNDPKIQHRLIDEHNGTVALTLDFRSKPE